MLALREGYFCFKILLLWTLVDWTDAPPGHSDFLQGRLLCSLSLFFICLLVLSAAICHFRLLMFLWGFSRTCFSVFSPGISSLLLYNSPELSSVQSRLYLVSRNSRSLYMCLLPITWQFPDLQPPAPVIMEHNIKKFLSWHLIQHVLFTFNLLVYTSFHFESHYLLLQYNAQDKAHIKLGSLKCNMRTCDNGTCICHT